MRDDRLRQQVGSDYAAALGLAAYCFASCEWNVVWCTERISPGSLKRITGDEMTAGRIARFFINVTRNMPRLPERDELQSLAATFAELVLLRNRIAHGKPCSGPSGESRLSAQSILEISDLEEAADAFSTCSIALNRMLHGFLATYHQASATRGA